MINTRSHTKSKFSSAAFVAGLVLACTSCTERNYPDEVASGIARLSVNNLARLTAAISTVPSKNNLPECRFGEFSSVSDKTTIESEGNGRGKAIIAFNDCEYDFGSEGTTLKILDGKDTTYYGKIKLSGTRSLSGLLTQNAEYPVIPSGPDGVQLKFSKVEFDNFKVKSPDLKETLTMINGDLSFNVQVHLGKHQDSKFCEVALPNLTFTNIKYAKSLVRLPGPRGEFVVDVYDSDFGAQVGIYGDVVNHLHGTMKIWDSLVKVPAGADKLDPEFKRETYDESLSRIESLTLPLQQQCRFEPELAIGVARLTVSDLGALMKDIVAANRESNDKRAECLLGSLETPPSELNKSGDKHGVAIWNFSNCVYDFGHGKVTLTGQRVVHGEITGNPKFPIIPTNKEILFNFSNVSFNKVRFENDSDSALTHESGSIAFSVVVHLGSQKVGDREIPTIQPNLTFKNVKYLGTNQLVLSRKAGKFKGDFKIAVEDSELDAQAGKFEDKENSLDGRMKIFGEWVLVRPDGHKLDPEYDEKNGSPWGGPSVGKDPAELYIKEVASGAARLSVRNLALLLAAISSPQVQNKRPECHFADYAGVEGHTTVEDHGNGRGKVIWHFAHCDFDLNGVKTQTLDAKKTLAYFGKVKLSGTRSITGLLTDNPDFPVIPTGPDGVDINISEAVFDNYRVDTQALDTQVADKSMTIKSGSASFSANIQLAKNPQTRLCEIPVDNLALRDVSYAPGSILIVPGPSDDILVQVDASDFSAQIGARGSLRNQLDGTMTLWGKNVKVPSGSSMLDTSDSAIYSENSPEVCTFEPDLALALSRLTVSNLGALVKEIVAKNQQSIPHRPECLLASFDAPHKKNENSAKFGDVVWEFNDCVYEIGAGRVTLSGKRTIHGQKLSLSELPVLPTKNEILFEFNRVQFDHVRFETNSKTSLTHEKGALSFDMVVHLENEKLGKLEIPSKPLSNLTFKNIKYLGKNELVLTQKSGKLKGNFKVSVEDSKLHAQNGDFAGKKDSLEGKMKIFGSFVELPPHSKLYEESEKAPTQEWSTGETLVSKIRHNTDKLATGIARLSAHHFAVLVGGLSLFSAHNAECRLRDFAFADGRTRIEDRGDGHGRVTWDFSGCEFDFGPLGMQVSEELVLFGKVKVSGTRSLSGLLTGNQSNLVIPSGPEGFVINFSDVSFDHFAVKIGAELPMTIVKGHATYSAEVSFGKNAKSHLCDEILPNIRLSKVRYQPDTLVKLSDGPYDFDAEVDSSDFEAQLFTGREKKNYLEGTLSVFGKSTKVPKDDSRLDVDFDENSLHSKGADVCFAEPVLAARISQLTMSNLGSIMREIVAGEKASVDNRKECKLSSFEAPSSQTNSVDAEHADVVWNFNNCVYQLGSGTVILSGKRILHGLPVGHDKVAVIPTNNDILFSFSRAELNGVSLDLASDNSLKHASTKLSFDAIVHLANEKLGTREIPSRPLSNVTFKNVKYLGKNDVVLTRTSDEYKGDYHVVLSDSELFAQAGTHNGIENELGGRMNVFGAWQPILPEYQELDPTFNKGSSPSQFGAKGLSIAGKISENADEVAAGVARLSVYSIANLLDAIQKLPTHARAECNFSSELNAKVEKKGRGRGKAIWEFENCEFDFGAGTLTSDNSIVAGKVTMSGTRSLSGLLTDKLQRPVIPSGPAGLEVAVTDIHFDNLSVSTPNTNKAFRIKEGNASFEANIHLGKHIDTRQCQIALPNPTVKDIRYASKTIVALPKVTGAFDIEIDHSSFMGQVGAHGKSINKLDGTVTIWGKTIVLPRELAPEFKMSDYQDSLAKIEKLEKPLGEFCEVESELIPSVARLTVDNLVKLTSQIVATGLPSQDNRPECLLGSIEQPYNSLKWVENSEADLKWNFNACTYALDQGSVTVSGFWVVRGKPTGFEKFPVLPTKESIEFHFESVAFNSFGFNKSGRLAFDFVVHLAKESLGSRQIPSRPLANPTLSNIKYLENSTVVLSLMSGSSLENHELVVEGSDFDAQMAKFGNKENKLEGTLKIFDTWQTFAPEQQYVQRDYDPVKPLELSGASIVNKITKNAPEVAAGVARLSVHSLGHLIEALQHLPPHIRAECNFVDEAKMRVEKLGQGRGRVTWDFEDCEFDFGQAGILAQDNTLVSGKVKMSGSRALSGLLTNKKNPAIPSGPGGLEISVSDIHFENFGVSSRDSNYAMTIHSGRGSFAAAIQLGKHVKSRICEVPLPNPTFKDIRFSPKTIVTLPKISGDLEIELDDAEFDAQVGVHKKGTNQLEGTLALWGETVTLPKDLIEKFSIQDYENSLARIEHLQLPLSDVCEVESELIPAIAGMTVDSLANLMMRIVATEVPSIDNRDECLLGLIEKPFSKVNWIDKTQADVIWNFNSCTYKLDEGHVTVSGHWSIRGEPTGIAKLPVVPTGNDIEFHFESVVFDNWGFNKSGQLAFDFVVHLANDSLGKRQIPSKVLLNTTFKNVRYLENSTVVLALNEGNEKHELVIEESDISAQVGRFEDKENTLEGKVKVFDTWHTISKEREYLQEDYNYANPPSAEVPGTGIVGKVHDNIDELATGIARLSVVNLGMLLEAMNSTPPKDNRPECVTNQNFIVGSSTLVDEGNGRGRVVTEFSDCEYDFDESKDSIFSGKVKVSGKRVLKGLLTQNPNNPLIPSGKDAIEIEISRVDFDNYKVAKADLEKRMTLRSGSASFSVVIQLGMNAQSGACSEPLPNIELRDIRFSSDTVARIGDDKGGIEVEINASELQAQIGVKGGARNSIAGAMTLWGKNAVVSAQLDTKAQSTEADPGFCNIEPKAAVTAARVVTFELMQLMQEIVVNKKASQDLRAECNLGAFDQARSAESRVGAKHGVATWDFKDCVYDIGGGLVSLTGQRSAFGRFTKSTKYPFVAKKALQFHFTNVTFNGVRFGNDTKVTHRSGSLAFDLEVAIETAELNPAFKNIVMLGNNEYQVSADSGAIKGDNVVVVQGSDMHAGIGKHDGQEDMLGGALKMFGENIELAPTAKLFDEQFVKPQLSPVVASQKTPLQGDPPSTYVRDIRNFFADVLDPPHGPPKAGEEILKETLVKHAQIVFWLAHRVELLGHAGIPQELETWIKPIGDKVGDMSEADFKEFLIALDEEDLSDYVVDMEKTLSSLNIEGFEGLSNIVIPEALGTNFSTFLKTVLNDYFPSQQSVDKKRILASVLRRTLPGADEIDTLLSIVYASGPFFQKLIQLLSDKLPKEDPKATGEENARMKAMKDALSSVKSNLPSIDPYDVGQYVKTLKDTYGVKIEVIRSLGAASVGEAYLADQVFEDSSKNRRIVVKFMRPSIEEIAQREHAFLIKVASNIASSMMMSYEQIAEQIFDELDFRHELANLKRGVEVYSSEEFPSIQVVKPILDFPENQYWMAMEFVDGKTFREIRGVRSDKEPRVYPLRFEEAKLQLMSKAVLLNMLSTVFIRNSFFAKKDGFFHGDLHEGNILMSFDEEKVKKWFEEKGIPLHKNMDRAQVEALIRSKDSPIKLILVDFGNSHELPSKERVALLNLFISAADISESPDAFLAAFSQLSPQDPDLIRSVKEQIKPFFDNRDEKFAARIGKSINVLQRNNLYIPGIVTAFYKSIDLLANAYNNLREDAKVHGSCFEALTLEEALTQEIVDELVFNRTLSPNRVMTPGENWVFPTILSPENIAAIEPNLKSHAFDRFVGRHIKEWNPMEWKPKEWSVFKLFSGETSLGQVLTGLIETKKPSRTCDMTY